MEELSSENDVFRLVSDDSGATEAHARGDLFEQLARFMYACSRAGFSDLVGLVHLSSKLLPFGFGNRSIDHLTHLHDVANTMIDLVVTVPVF